MPQAKYLIVGAGMAADAAVRGIREVDPDGSIILVGAENDPPYKRPLLSKGLWTGKPLDKVWSNTDKKGAEITLGRMITTLDLDGHRATDDHGNTYQFNKLLLATGSTPRDPGLGDHQVINFRSLDDYRRLRSVAEQGKTIAVIGGGFIGSELATSLTTNDKAVTMIFPEETISSRVLPPDLGRYMTAYYQEKGVTVLSGSMATSLEKKNGALSLRVRNQQSGAEQEVTVDGIVAGIGALPNLDLAKAAGLEVDNGVLVDEHLQTSHPDVYAAGDIASVQQPALGGRRRVEHEDAAKSMGKTAGRNMAGQPAPYHYIPLFYSDLFDMGYEAVGDVDTRLETVADWAEPNRKGVIYYLKDDKVRGVLLWNVWEQVDAARELITAGKQVKAEELRGRIPVDA
jgi:3-phenylpropionate/trans-cinnamate dioxygenase ferredoxin reductase component